MKYVFQPPLPVPVPPSLFDWTISTPTALTALAEALTSAGVHITTGPVAGGTHLIVAGEDLPRVREIARGLDIPLTTSAVVNDALPESVLDALIVALPGIVSSRFGDLGTIERTVLLSVNAFDPVGCAVQVTASIEMRIRDDA